MRTRIDGRPAWCDRRLLARIHRYTLDRLRREIAPVTAAQFVRFLARWQHAGEEHRLSGPRGVAEVVGQLAGFETPAWAWEGTILPTRVRGYKREWLDQLTLSGELVWGRLWSAGAGPDPPRPDLASSRAKTSRPGEASAPGVDRPEPTGTSQRVREILSGGGAMFFPELQRAAGLSPAELQSDLEELIALGWVTCDAYSGLRALLIPPWRRVPRSLAVGRWSLLAPGTPSAGIGRVRGAQASAAHRRRLPQDARAREAAPSVERDRPRAAHARGARRDPRGPLRGGLRR